MSEEGNEAMTATRLAPGADPTLVADARLLNEVRSELRSARRKFGPIASPHEGYAVMLEELDEFWQEVKRKDTDPAAMRAELVQVAAMAIRTLVDCGLDTPAVRGKETP